VRIGRLPNRQLGAVRKRTSSQRARWIRYPGKEGLGYSARGEVGGQLSRTWPLSGIWFAYILVVAPASCLRALPDSPEPFKKAL